MRTTKRWTAIFLTLVWAATGHAQQGPATPAASLEAYQFLAGGVWTAEMQIPGESGVYVAEYTFEWVLGKKFLQSRHSTKRDGKTLSSTLSMIGWDAEQQRVAQWGFNNMGMTAVLYAQPPSADAVLTFEGKLGAGAMAPHARVTYLRRGENEMEVKTEFLRDGKYVLAGALTLRRS